MFVYALMCLTLCMDVSVCVCACCVCVCLYAKANAYAYDTHCLCALVCQSLLILCSFTVAASATIADFILIAFVSLLKSFYETLQMRLRMVNVQNEAATVKEQRNNRFFFFSKQHIFGI